RPQHLPPPHRACASTPHVPLLFLPCPSPLAITARRTPPPPPRRIPPTLVLNASRHHGEGDSRPCSQARLRPASAQRLSASRRGGLPTAQSWPVNRGAQRLPASRRGGQQTDL